MPLPRFLACLFLILGCTAAAGGARAAAIASVETNFFSVSPSAVVIGGDWITGDAAQDYLSLSGATLEAEPLQVSSGGGIADSGYSADQVGPTLSYSVYAFSRTETAGSASASMSLQVAFDVTNASDRAIDGFVLDVLFSAFNPGGPAIGAAVDDLATEFASFVSYQTWISADSHACRVDDPASASYYEIRPPSGAACGVAAPDASEGELSGGPLAPGESQRFLAGLFVETRVSKVPEPPLLPLLLTALAGMGALRLRRAA